MADFKDQVRDVMDGFHEREKEDRQVEQHAEQHRKLVSDPHDEFWCLMECVAGKDGHTTVRVKTISDPPDILRLMGLGAFEATARTDDHGKQWTVEQTTKRARNRMHRQYQVHMSSIRYGKLMDHNVRTRARNARFRIADRRNR